MAGKGDGLMTMDCEDLAGSGYPYEISLLGFINLLGGTDDRNSPEHWKWTRMVWAWLVQDKTGPDDYKRWSNQDRQNPAYKSVNEDRYVVLVMHTVTPAVAAKWLKAIGVAPDSLSDEVKYWLGDYLGKPGKSTPHHQLRRDLLSEVLERLQGIDPNLDLEAMPGTRADLLKYCQWSHPGVFEMAESTFKSYLKGICSFCKGARPSSYYREKQSRLS